MTNLSSPSLLQSRLSRRRFIATSMAAAGLAVAYQPLGALAQSEWQPKRPLVPAADGIIELMQGFQCKVLLRRGDLLSEGTPRPANADGMCAVPGPNNTTVLCLNHELAYSSSHPVPHVAGDYDPNAVGGTSVVLVSPEDRSVIGSWISSSGTVRNCAGGVTPWGTWITVEENEDLPGSSATKSHGWAFEVDPYAPLGGGTPRQVRLTNLGRFNREAVVIDPATRVVYQTEDAGDGLFYRFVPDGSVADFGAYATAPGKLQAASIPGLTNANAAVVGAAYEPVWLDVPDPDGEPVKVRHQSYSGDPTRFFRGEGAWWSEVEKAAYFDCTGGGSSGHYGQIWRYAPATNNLTLVYQSNDQNVLEMPDNLLVLPWGDIMLCEDGSGQDYLRILTRSGKIIDFARNNVSEFAGACFSTSPDTLYVNIQGASITLAIWGPWQTLSS